MASWTDIDTASAIRAVTVYCASSAEVDPIYLKTARHMGQAIAAASWTLVYGGNRAGCMLEVAEGARERGGKVVGVTPQLFVDQNWHDTKADELVVTPGMRERKLLLEQRGDAFVVLPGGLGTYEELFEQIVNRQLRYHEKPIVALDLLGYFQPLRDLIEAGIAKRFIKPRARDVIEFAGSVQEVIHRLRHPHHIGSATPATLTHEAAGGH